MIPSLAAQLQAQAAPQTSRLVDSKSRASILFEPKEAAEKDRQQIFDLGRDGLAELISTNPAFQQFQNTLFDATSINLERSTQTKDVNETLNKNIRKFLLQLSPYFLVRAAHCCLEWLIRRYAINEYNVDDMMALILPYHDTKMFVKCLQTIPLKDKKSRWYWMKPIQKPGVPMSKQAIINRAANDPFFLKFVSSTTLAAVNELQIRPYSLQALFAFYTTTILGALDGANEITEAHILSIKGTLVKGLSSDVVDFCAASMMLTGFLMTKIEFEDAFLKKIIEKLSKNLSRQELRRESLVLLTIICQTQPDTSNLVAEILLSKVIDASTIVSTLGFLYKDNIDVLPICRPLIAKCLGKVDKHKTAEGYHKFIELLLMDITFNSDDANAVIR